MVETVVSIGLPVDEKMEIKKNRINPETLTGKEKRICFVTGTHGDELEGQYVCYQMNKIINENKQYLKGIVDIYPALNPLGIDSISRGIPMFDLDMNRIFPGDKEGAMPEYVASKIIEDIKSEEYILRNDVDLKKMSLKIEYTDDKKHEHQIIIPLDVIQEYSNNKLFY